MTGAELKQRRQRLGLTQTALAKLWGTKQATISDWEAEKIKIQHPQILNHALNFLESQNMNTPILSMHIRELIETTKHEPLLIRFDDSGDLDIVPASATHHGNPLGWSENKREPSIIANRDDIWKIIQKTFKSING